MTKLKIVRLNGFVLRRTILVFFFVIVVIVLLLWGSWFGKDFKPKEKEFPSATILQVPVPLPSFLLIDHMGKSFTINNLSRKWTFMFFGYTNCPDVCPLALVNFNGLYHNLAKDGDLLNTQFVFISVDPQRDNVANLKEYVTFFNKDFIGVTGKLEMIESLTHPLGVAYRRVPGGTADSYLIDHTASFLLIDPLGRMLATFLPPHNVEQIAEDFRRIRRKYAQDYCIPGEQLRRAIFDYTKEKK